METSQEKYQIVNNALPGFNNDVVAAFNNSYSAKPISNKKFQKKTKEYKVVATKRALSVIRNIFAIVIAFMMSMFMQGLIADTFVVGLLSFTVAMLLLMNTRAESKFLNFIKILCLLGFSAGWCILFYNNCAPILLIQHYVLACIIVGIVSFIVAIILIYVAETNGANNLIKLLFNVLGQTFFFACGILVYAILVNWINVPHGISAVLVVIAYGFFSLCTTFVSGYSFDNKR